MKIVYAVWRLSDDYHGGTRLISLWEDEAKAKEEAARIDGIKCCPNNSECSERYSSMVEKLEVN